MLWLAQALDILSRGERCVVVTVAQVRGSAPREAGTRMLVWDSGMVGSVGGGHLELHAIASAHRMLRENGGPAADIETFSLGPDLNQCCGGQVTLLLEALDATALAWLREWAEEAHGPARCAVVTHRHGDSTQRSFVRSDGLDLLRLPDFLQRPVRALLAGARAVHVVRTPDGGIYLVESAGESRDTLLLFGAGHVGKATACALAPLPFRIVWIDTREDVFPAELPPQVSKIASAAPPGEVAGAPPGAFYLVMTHSHPLDLEICAQILRRGDFGFLGLIGSETKRARFASRLRAIGIAPALLNRLTCPIGIPGIRSKEPAAIAAAVAAQLLIVAERRQAERKPMLAAVEVGT